PLDLVRLEQLVAVDRPHVPGDGDSLRPVVRQQLEEHVREPEQGVSREALARCKLLRKREEGAIGEVVAIDEEEPGVAHRGGVELQFLARQGFGSHATKLSSGADAWDRNRAARGRAPGTSSEAACRPPRAAPASGAAAPRRRLLPCAAGTRSRPRARRRRRGAAARRGVVASLIGRVEPDELRGDNRAIVDFAGCAAAPRRTEAIRDLYAALAARWVAAGATRHLVYIPASDQTLADPRVA